MIHITFHWLSKKFVNFCEILTKYFECDVLRYGIAHTIVSSASVSEIINEIKINRWKIFICAIPEWLGWWWYHFECGADDTVAICYLLFRYCDFLFMCGIWFNLRYIYDIFLYLQYFSHLQYFFSLWHFFKFAIFLIFVILEELAFQRD